MNWNPPRWVLIYLIIFENQKISKISDHSEFFFALQYIKNWTKVVSWKKNFIPEKKNCQSEKNFNFFFVSGTQRERFQFIVILTS